MSSIDRTVGAREGAKMDDDSPRYIALSLLLGIPLSIVTTWWLVQHGVPWWLFFLMR